MDQTLLCVLHLFLLSTILCCGQAQDAELTLEPNSSLLFVGESATFTCDMKEVSSKDWLYEFRWNGQQVASVNTNNSYTLNPTADLSGEYQCVGYYKGSASFTKRSNNITLSVSARRATATVAAERRTIPDGGSVKLSCSVENSADWKYDWFQLRPGSKEAAVKMDAAQNFISISSGGIYWCRGRRGNPVYLTEQSEDYYMEKTLSNSVAVTLQHSWTEIFQGETISISCEIQGGEPTGWEYEWRTTSSHTPPTQRQANFTAFVSHRGEYWCKGRRDWFSSTEWSKAFTLEVSYKPRPSVTADNRIIPVDGKATLTCSVENSAQWDYYWFRHSSNFSEISINEHGKADKVISVSQGGIYSCRGGRGNPVLYSDDSDVVSIEQRVSNRAVVSLLPSRPVVFTGETITVTCSIDGDEHTGWVYEWSKPDSLAVSINNGYRIINASASSGGNYRCLGKRRDLHASTEWSDVVTVIVLENKPKAHIRASSRVLPAGGSVTLACSVKPSSSGWTYFWYRGKGTSETLIGQEVDSSSEGEIRVSEEGLYGCRGGRGDQMFFTDFSDSVTIHKAVTDQPVVTQHPDWPVVYHGETITLRCEIQGDHTEWAYEWMTTSSDVPPNQAEYRINLDNSFRGSYWCKGRRKSAPHTATSWSMSLKLPDIKYEPRQPVLSVSPSWLSPGSSVTLRCEVEHPSAGWRFYWYKAVPDLSLWYLLHSSYTYEPLPGSKSGTKESSYIIHGQRKTAGYSCGAKRGEAEYSTDLSEPKFVWSGDFDPAASLTVNPGRVQHFTSDTISLNRDSVSAEWELMTFPPGRPYFMFQYLELCFFYRDTCDIDYHYEAVLWLASGSGEFSNAINITIHDGDIILESPVHPVTEGESVTLGCKLRRENFTSTVVFYKNDEVIQNSDNQQLNIPAVSKSDEGFYRCQHSDEVSPQSWMAVKSSTPAFPVSLTVGLVTGVLLAALLTLLLIHLKKILSTRLTESQTNQASAVQNVCQDENQQQIYSSLLHGDTSVYESIRNPANTGNGGRADEDRNVRPHIQLRGVGQRKIREDQQEDRNSDYHHVIPDLATGP